MQKISLNSRGNTMPVGNKSIRVFYEEMIETAKENIGKTTEFNTVIDKKLILLLEKRLYTLQHR